MRVDILNRIIECCLIMGYMQVIHVLLATAERVKYLLYYNNTFVAVELYWTFSEYCINAALSFLYCLLTNKYIGKIFNKNHVLLYLRFLTLSELAFTFRAFRKKKDKRRSGKVSFFKILLRLRGDIGGNKII